eukprot:gene11183-11265_t
MRFTRRLKGISVTPDIGIQVVIGAGTEFLYESALKGLNLLPITYGGATRQESVFKGLQALKIYEPDLVLIHDAARPYISTTLIDRVIKALNHAKTCIPVISVTDTIKRIENNVVKETIERSTLRRVQTPQGFDFLTIFSLHQQFSDTPTFTDDALLCEFGGIPVHCIEGEEENIKITTTKDLRQMIDIRVGNGIDVHQIGPGDGVTIFGCYVPCGFSLIGHSDADVGLHSITDALLGAIGDADIGYHFSPKDERWRGADSAQFLKHAAGKVRAMGGKINHIDATLIGERPKIEELFKAGADVFRLNFSHGSHEDHEERVRMIREVEKNIKRPIAIMMDLQGPKLRVGTFAEGKIDLKPNQKFRFDLNPEPGNSERVYLPHPEIFSALKPETDLLLDDGKIRLKVLSCEKDNAETLVINGGELSNRKGVNVPSVILPISALTEKDKKDLNFGLGLGVDWIALSFVQKPEDIQEAKNIIQEEIIKLADAIMVARGDLGVEMMPEEVPSIQKKIIRACRFAGKPVVVATQMLDSMIYSPSPTRAEASDVAVAIYDGVDAVMLSAESASGQYPVEAVEMMDRIISKTEQDPVYREMMDSSHLTPLKTVADAITASARQVAHIINAGVIVTFSETGSTTLRAARERPESSILALTPNLDTARFLALVWGAHAALTEKEEQTFYGLLELLLLVLDQRALLLDQVLLQGGLRHLVQEQLELAMKFAESSGT